MIDLHASQEPGGLLRQISMAFGESSGLQPDASLIATTAALVGAVILGYALWRRSCGDAGGSGQSGTTVKRRDISAILEQALLNRSRIDLSFHPIITSRQTISCTLFELSDVGVTLEMPIGVEPSESWLGRLMVCYFRIPRENKAPYFYTFVSPVAGTRKQGDLHYIVLDIPAKVELGQKRRHLRLELPPHDIKDFRIWPAAEDGSFPYEADPQTWPEPLAMFTRGGDGLRVLDLSGGGIKLSVDPARFGSLKEFVAKHPVLFMCLELEPVDGMELPPYLMAARLRTKAEDHGTLMLGYEFVECCTTEGPETIDWVKIEPEHGIDELVTWVFKRHLELYREREIV